MIVSAQEHPKKPMSGPLKVMSTSAKSLMLTRLVYPVLPALLNCHLNKMKHPLFGFLKVWLLLSASAWHLCKHYRICQTRQEKARCFFFSIQHDVRCFSCRVGCLSWPHDTLLGYHKQMSCLMLVSVPNASLSPHVVTAVITICCTFTHLWTSPVCSYKIWRSLKVSKSSSYFRLHFRV